MATHALPSKKHLPFGGARAINNPVLTEFIDFTMMNDFMSHVRSPHVVDQFLNRYRHWLQSSQLNDFKGLDVPWHAAYSNGTTEVFDKWYIRNQGKRLRMFRGEYMYHIATHRNLNLSYAWLEDEPLDFNDHVIISMPFADNGDLRYETQSVLDSAAIMNIPVLIDAAYVGLTQGLEFNFNHPAIDTIAFSLSKSFPVANARIGMRLTRHNLDDGLDIYRLTGYENRWGAALGNILLASYGVDYNVTAYGHWQKFKCQEMGIEASPTVIFGLGDGQWSEYERGGLFNRLFLGGFYESQF